MKITNTTNVPDYAIRRMVSWCCKRHGIPVRRIANVKADIAGNTGRSSDVWNLDVVGRDSFEIFLRVDACEKLKRSDVEMTASLLYHVYYHIETNGWCRSWDRCKKAGSDACIPLTTSLLEDWHKPPKSAPPATAAVGDVLSPDDLLKSMQPAQQRRPKKTKKQLNAERAEKNLRNWERKLKLAQTKVKKYKTQVRRYVREGVLGDAK